MNRRELLSGGAMVAALGVAMPVVARRKSGSSASTGTGGGRGQYRVLYNNDLTNLLSCVSPWHAADATFSPAMIDASVREVAGKVDVHLLSPGLCWVPTWQSKVVPPADHYRWFTQTTGLPVDPIGRYVLNGGDVVARFVAACRANGETPFISFRLNDTQHLNLVGQKNPALATVPRFYVDNPQYKLGPDPRSWAELGQNWTIPAVRAYKFALIQELCANYDIDGLELDFERYPTFFADNVDPGQRARIMTAFVSDVRGALDRGAKGKRRSLGVRIPAYVDSLAPLGIDLRAFVSAGVDMVTVSDFFLTSDEDDFAQIREMASGAAVYDELTQATSRVAPRPGQGGPGQGGPGRPGGYGLEDLANLVGLGGDDDRRPRPPGPGARPGFMRTTPAQLITGANNAYRQGAAGVSLFNFAYYRQHSGDGPGPFSEPPFDVLPHLRDAGFVAAQPQWAVGAADFNIPKRTQRLLPLGVGPTKQRQLTLTLFPPEGARRAQLRFRLRNPSSGRWIASVNGRMVKQAESVSPIINDPFPANAEQAAPDYIAFDVPVQALRAGDNTITAVLGGGPNQIIDYVDLLVV